MLFIQQKKKKKKKKEKKNQQLGEVYKEQYSKKDWHCNL